jgi:endonuclease YncB( thermonuclease family)
MSRRASRFLAPAILLLLVHVSRPAAAKRVDGAFTAVRDATVLVFDHGDGAYDVRIYGVEAPAEGQAFAAEARQFVRERLLGREAGIRFKYRNASGEMVARIFYRPAGAAEAPERDFAVDLVAAGLAWVKPGARYRPVDVGEVDLLTAALLEARAARRGIWSAAVPVAPWTYRGQRLPVEPTSQGASEGVVGNLDRNISRLSGDDNECAIAKNPNNAQQLAAHCNSLETPWRSSDGGLTWTLGGSIGSYCCDPNLAWDSYGNLYATFINGSLNGIVTKVSTDGGATFDDLATFSGGVDQPSVVATDLTGGNVALWIVWNQGGMRARGALVTGLGVPNIGAFGPTQTIATGGSCSFGDLSVSPGGVVVQVCGPQTGEIGGNIVVNVDADGLGPGDFGPAIHPTTTNVGGFDFIPAQASRSVDSETGLVFDRNPASPHFGRLFLLYTDELVQESDDTNIMVRHSDDNGSTWSAPVQVNTDATARSQILPKIAADPATGNIAICWHDARNSASNVATEIYCDTTTPATYPAFVGNVPVSDGVSISNGAGVEYGDYTGLAVGGGIAHPVWADTSNSTGDNPDGSSNFDAYTDRLAVLAADYTFGVTPPVLSVCAPANATFDVDVGAFGGFTDPVNLSASGHPAGTTTGFSVNPVTPAGASVLTIGNTGAGTPGLYSITVTATSTTGPKGVNVGLNLATIGAAQPVLTSPANGATHVPVPTPLSWAAVPQAASYTVQIATDAAFTDIVEQAAGLASPAYTATAIQTNTLHYWRVQAVNACATSGFSATFSFRTVAAPGDCATGTVANPLYQYGFEAGTSGWTHSGTGDTWGLAASNPHSGASHFHAQDPAGVSDQRLVSPPVALPSGQNPVVIKFWHAPDLEPQGDSECYDGGILEVSTNGGASWTPLPNSSLLVGPYTGVVDSGFSNPLGGLQAWCGESSYFQTIADLSAYAGQTAQFRFRLGSDTIVGNPGWNVDDVAIQSCQVEGLFLDGFNSGDTAAWSLVFP